MNRPLTFLSGILLAAASAASAQEPARLPRPFAAEGKLADVARLGEPAEVRIGGWLGARVNINASQRLLNVDMEPLLAGYKQKPGSHPWIGEHVGKWLHAATLAWAYTGDPKLRAKLDDTVRQLVAAQEPDGYLGTYVPAQRFGLYDGADWDVWSHKYNLIGLLTYYQYTGSEPALNACRKMGDLLIRTFPNQKSILAAGTHMGMAATSILEPVVLLYRATGDERYLTFARYIVSAYDEPNGPKILATLRAGKGVNETANAKAYEMLSNLVGICELARATGDRELLAPIVHAWDDIVANRLYPTGSASAGELFQKDHDLPSIVAAHIGETCVTTTWIQLNLQLLRVTGEAKYADELDRAFYNHLAAAQHPNGNDWCYYTALEGKKQYDQGITCCHSSGPRGMALAPFAAYMVLNRDGKEVLGVSTLETSKATLRVNGQAVTIEQESGFPAEGKSTLTLKLAQPARFGLVVRVPSWALPAHCTAPDRMVTESQTPGWLVLPAREWRDGEKIALEYQLATRTLAGEHGNAGKAALAYGPFVLAYDAMNNRSGPRPSAAVLAADPAARRLAYPPLAIQASVTGPGRAAATAATFVPFADAGATGGIYRVWLRAAGSPAPVSTSLLGGGDESRSRGGNVGGSINDDDAGSFVVTFDGAPADRDWYAVAVPEAVEINRVEYCHGRSFHDGGWFDATAGKPEVQVQTREDGAWETVGRLDAYPATTATDSKGIAEGQAFTLKLGQPRKVVAVRVIGVPAHGDKPSQAFSSCGELSAFRD